MGHFPFTMGGNVWQPIFTDVKVIEEQNCGKGFTFFSFKTPRGTIKVCESTTGAILGDSFSEMRSSIKEATKKRLTKQIEEGRKQMLTDRHDLNNEEFFKMYKF